VRGGEAIRSGAHSGCWPWRLTRSSTTAISPLGVSVVCACASSSRFLSLGQFELSFHNLLRKSLSFSVGSYQSKRVPTDTNLLISASTNWRHGTLKIGPIESFSCTIALSEAKKMHILSKWR
jgi:hypothetical protein